jgi:hypothetical protein
VWIVFTCIVLNLGFIVLFTRLRSAQAGDESLAES